MIFIGDLFSSDFKLLKDLSSIGGVWCGLLGIYLGLSSPGEFKYSGFLNDGKDLSLRGLLKFESGVLRKDKGLSFNEVFGVSVFEVLTDSVSGFGVGSGTGNNLVHGVEY